MPIILPGIADPSEWILPGEQMRAPTQDREPAKDQVLLGFAGPTGFGSTVPDEDAFAPMNSFVEGSRLSTRRLKTGILHMRVNAGIATPCGAWVFLDWSPLLSPNLWATERWQIAGATKDSTGSALAGCRVIVNKTSRLSIDGIEAATAETVSDGSGNYAVEVPLNMTYQLTAYKVGSPDVAGVSRNDVTPTQI